MGNAKESIKQGLKDAGYNTRMVSVANRHAGYSSALELTIRDSSVNYELVQSIATANENIHYDEATQEILSGGNTFVDVRISDQVREIWSQTYFKKVTDAIERLEDENHGREIDERFTVFYHRHKGNLKIWDERKGSWLDGTFREEKGLAIHLFILTQPQVEKKVPIGWEVVEG